MITVCLYLVYLNESLRAVICRFVNLDGNISEPKRCLPPPSPSPPPSRPSPRTWPASSKAYFHRKSTSFPCCPSPNF